MTILHYSLDSYLEIRSDDDPINVVDRIFLQHQQRYRILQVVWDLEFE